MVDAHIQAILGCLYFYLVPDLVFGIKHGDGLFFDDVFDAERRLIIYLALEGQLPYLDVHWLELRPRNGSTLHGVGGGAILGGERGHGHAGSLIRSSYRRNRLGYSRLLLAVVEVALNIELDLVDLGVYAV